jgi:transcription elongation factor GreA
MTERAATAPPVLTAPGRAWVEGRLERAQERLDHIADELFNERTEQLIVERRQLREQVEELTQLLKVAIAPGAVVDDPTIVELGDEVTVEFPDGERETFLIVHPVEAGMDEHRTASDAPLAQAVLGHRPGDRLTVSSPAGDYAITIISRDRIS